MNIYKLLMKSRINIISFLAFYHLSTIFRFEALILNVYFKYFLENKNYLYQHFLSKKQQKHFILIITIKRRINDVVIKLILLLFKEKTS